MHVFETTDVIWSSSVIALFIAGEDYDDVSVAVYKRKSDWALKAVDDNDLTVATEIKLQ